MILKYLYIFKVFAEDIGCMEPLLGKNTRVQVPPNFQWVYPCFLYGYPPANMEIMLGFREVYEKSCGFRNRRENSRMFQENKEIYFVFLFSISYTPRILCWWWQWPRHRGCCSHNSAERPSFPSVGLQFGRAQEHKLLFSSPTCHCLASVWLQLWEVCGKVGETVPAL